MRNFAMAVTAVTIVASPLEAQVPIFVDPAEEPPREPPDSNESGANASSQNANQNQSGSESNAQSQSGSESNAQNASGSTSGTRSDVRAGSDNLNQNRITVRNELRLDAAQPAPAAAASASASATAAARSDDDDPPDDEAEVPDPEAIFLHGFRMGYLYFFNIETPLYGDEPHSQRFDDRYDMRSAHQFMIGYEIAWRMIGYDWLNLLLVANIMIAGLEQARFYPSGNLLFGFELAEMVQIGVGVSFTPTKEEPAHIVFAAGWTPRIGSFYVPVHVVFVPDIEGHHRVGATVGINFF